MGNEKQTEAWYNGFKAGRDSVFIFMRETVNKGKSNVIKLESAYDDWCNADKP